LAAPKPLHSSSTTSAARNAWKSWLALRRSFELCGRPGERWMVRRGANGGQKTELDALAGPESLITGSKEDAPEWRAKL
jgi:hypothetical protein